MFLINLKDVPGIDLGFSGDMTLPKTRPSGPVPVGAVRDDEFDCAAMPWPPKNPLPYFRRLKAARFLHTGCEQLRDAGGPVTLVKLGPKWLIPTVVIVTSPSGGHDMLARSPAVMERVAVHDEMRRLMGDNLFDLRYDQWRPLRRALQPLFTKQHVAQFAGHIARAAETLVDGWPDGEIVDLDHECRAVTLRALGRSVLGVDLDAHAEALAGSMRVALTYLMERGSRSTVTGFRPGPCSSTASMRSSVIPHCGSARRNSTRSDSWDPGPGPMTVGSTSRSAPVRAAVSVTISPCWRPRWRSRPLSAGSS